MALDNSIGAHRADEKELVVSAPVVTISFGESAILRLPRCKGVGGAVSEVTDGSVLVIPDGTNMAHTHQVTAPKVVPQRVV